MEYSDQDLELHRFMYSSALHQVLVLIKPQHIFFIVGESIPQWSLDKPYKELNICPGLWDFKDDPHTAQVP